MMELLGSYFPFIIAGIAAIYGYIMKNKAQLSDIIAKQSRREVRVAQNESVKYGRMNKEIVDHHNAKDDEIDEEVDLAKAKRDYFSK